MFSLELLGIAKLPWFVKYLAAHASSLPKSRVFVTEDPDSQFGGSPLASTQPAGEPFAPATTTTAAVVAAASSSTTKPEDDWRMLCYMASVIVALPYEDDEPLQMIAHLSRVISTHGAALQGAVTSTMRKLAGAAAAGEDEDEPETKTAPTTITTTNADGTTTTTTLAVKEETQEEQLQRLQEECHAAMAMCILLAVKINLQDCYGIKEGAVEEWQAKSSISSAAAAATTKDAADGKKKPSRKKIATKCIKKEHVILSFTKFPFLVSQVPTAPTAAEADNKKAKRPKRGKKDVEPEAPAAAAPPSLVPPLLRAQFDFVC
jgi:Tfp pilus assembly protein PilV